MDKRIGESKSPFKMSEDFTTENLIVKMTERFSFGLTDFRSVFGSFPTTSLEPKIDEPAPFETLPPDKDIWAIIDEFRDQKK